MKKIKNFFYIGIFIITAIFFISSVVSVIAGAIFIFTDIMLCEDFTHLKICEISNFIADTFMKPFFISTIILGIIVFITGGSSRHAFSQKDDYNDLMDRHWSGDKYASYKLGIMSREDETKLLKERLNEVYEEVEKYK